MKTPPLLLGAALCFWGYATGLVWLGVAAGAAVESAQLVQMRWQFSQADLDRIWNLCVALFFGAFIVAFVSGDSLSTVSELLRDNNSSSRLATINQSKRSLFQLLQWLPLMFLPILLAQVYGETERMNLSTFSWWLRRKRGRPGREARYLAMELSVFYPFFACCLFAASSGNERSWWFATGLVTLVIWALALNRSHSFSRLRWFSSLALALLFGFGLQFGMLQLQKLVQRLDEALLADWGRNRNADPDESQTRIGAIGRLKLSGRIVLRVRAKSAEPPPLLQLASYSIYQSRIWTTARRGFEHVAPENNLSTWILRSARNPLQTLTISGYLSNGKGLLALPHGVARISELPALSVATNGFGSVRVDDGPGWFQIEAVHGGDRSMDFPPLPKDDLEIPPQERSAVKQIVASLHLERFGRDPIGQEQVVRSLERFFANNFTYSTWQDADHLPTSHQSALARFLLQNRTGHCEYFASATVLLLRAAGIPARYATGFSVHEKKGDGYVVRERDAHAWCLAWIGGAWQNVDTTPADWRAMEASRASRWEPVWDACSWLWFEFSKWRWGHADWKRYLLWLVLPLLAFAVGKLILENQWSRAKRKSGPSKFSGPRAGLDSEFYAIEAALRRAGFEREPGETASQWLARLSQTGLFQTAELAPILDYHYRLRFDPDGLNPGERASLRSSADAWLRSHRNSRVRRFRS